jgi:hypothetical protein
VPAYTCIPYLNNSLSFAFSDFNLGGFSVSSVGYLYAMQEIPYIAATSVRIKCSGGTLPVGIQNNTAITLTWRKSDGG